MVIAAIPLKPTTRIGPADPPIINPNGKRLATFGLKEIERDIGFLADLGFGKPAFRKLVTTIVEIFAFENAMLQYLLRRKMRLKIWGKVFARWLIDHIAVI